MLCKETTSCMNANSSPVIVHYSVQSMGYRQYRAFRKFSSDGLLDEIIGFHVHCCCGFVEDQDLGLS